jgi:hypothetical protein
MSPEIRRADDGRRLPIGDAAVPCAKYWRWSMRSAKHRTSLARYVCSSGVVIKAGSLFWILVHRLCRIVKCLTIQVTTSASASDLNHSSVVLTFCTHPTPPKAAPTGQNHMLCERALSTAHEVLFEVQRLGRLEICRHSRQIQDLTVKFAAGASFEF